MTSPAARGSPGTTALPAFHINRKPRRGVTELKTEIRNWITEWNMHPKPFVWTKSANDILETVGEYCQRITRLGY